MSPSPTQPLRGAIIGAGYFSQFHYEAWTRIPEVKIVAASNRTLEKAEKQIALLGVEPPSVAGADDILEVTEIHKILLGANITIVESLKKLHQIKQDTIEFIALPLKLTDGDGSPVRALARI
jgi:kynurenine formamidase